MALPIASSQVAGAAAVTGEDAIKSVPRDHCPEIITARSLPGDGRQGLDALHRPGLFTHADRRPAKAAHLRADVVSRLEPCDQRCISLGKCWIGLTVPLPPLPCTEPPFMTSVDARMALGGATCPVG